MKFIRFSLESNEGMRLHGGPDFSPDSHLELTPAPGTPPPVTWLSSSVLSKAVGLRLRLERRDLRGRGCWHLVDLEVGSELVGQRLRSRDPESLMSTVPTSSEMQTASLDPQFILGPQQAKIPGRRRGRPPIRKLEFQSDFIDTFSPLKVPKKRGRKPGFKLKPRMGRSPLAPSAPSSTPEPELGSIPQDAAIVPHSATPQVPTDTLLPDDFTCEPPVDSKRYAIDPSDSAFNVMTSQYQTKHSYGYRGSSCSIPIGMLRQMSSPASFQDGNRNTCSLISDTKEGKRPAGKDPSSWGVEDVVWFIKEADPQALGPHAEAFRKHEIDGDALLLLKSELMMKYLGLKLGPALKLCYHIDRLRQSWS